MIIQKDQADYINYHASSKTNYLRGSKVFSFNIDIQSGDQKLLKTFEALLDVNSSASLCLTQDQARDLLLIQEDITKEDFYIETGSLCNGTLDFTVVLKDKFPAWASVEVFLPEDPTRKKKFQQAYGILHIISDEAVKDLGYHPENGQILLGRQYLDGSDATVIEGNGSLDPHVVFSVHKSEKLLDWDSKEGEH